MVVTSLEVPSRPMLPRSPEDRIVSLQTVLEVTKLLAAERDVERLLDLIIREACRTLHCERASLFLYDDARQELYTRKVTQLEGMEEIRLSRDEGIVGLVARERRTVHIPDPYNHPLFNPAVDRCTQFRTENILCAPLVSWGEGKLLGVLQLLNRRDATFGDDDRKLLEAFTAHAAIAIDRAILAQHYEEKTRLLVSLDVARKVQAGFFPRTLPVVPGYEMAAASRPADATGGDYYDLIPLASGQLGVVVADVCGHGLGPSLLMASVRAMLRGIAIREPPPETLLTELGQAMHADLAPTHRFITLMYGALDPVEHCFRFANAGHGPVALHYRAADNQFRWLVDDDARGCPLGIVEQMFAACRSAHLAPGDMLILGTDGLVETRRDGQQFGLARLSELVAERSKCPVQEVLDYVLATTTEYEQSGRPDDDLTLMVIRRK